MTGGEQVFNGGDVRRILSRIPAQRIEFNISPAGSQLNVYVSIALVLGMHPDESYRRIDSFENIDLPYGVASCRRVAGYSSTGFARCTAGRPEDFFYQSVHWAFIGCYLDKACLD